MQARMQVVQGAKTKEMRLRLPTVIGRGGDSKIKLPASTVSRHHCEIYEYEGQIVVRDLGSSNGTIVNGHKIKGPTFVTPEDELTIGPVTVRLSELKEAAPKELKEAPAASDYPVAPAEEAAPSFEELPAEDVEPVGAVAASQDADSAVEREPSDDPNDDSVLQYAEPKSSGRSFVGIAPASDQPEAVTDAPVFDGLENEEKPQVKADESALNNFFNSLEDDS